MKKISANLQKKEGEVQRLKTLYSEPGKWVFIFDYKSMRAISFSELRRKVKSVGGSVDVVKNRVNKFAFASTGFSGLNANMSGQLASVNGSSPIEIVKILKEYHDNSELKLVACGDGSSVYDLKSLIALANLPSLQVLQGQLLGVLLAVPTKLVNTLLEPSRSLVRVCDSYVKKSNN